MVLADQRHDFTVALVYPCFVSYIWHGVLYVFTVRRERFLRFRINKLLRGDTRNAAASIGVSVLAMGVVVLVVLGQGWPHWPWMMVGLVALLAGMIIVQVHGVVGQLTRQSSDIKRAAVGNELHYVRVLQRILRFAETRDKFSKGSSERVGRLARSMAIQMGMSEEQADFMDLAGQLRDIGMLAVSESLTSRQSALGGSDFRTMQKHVEVSYEILYPLESLRGILPAIRCHHERMNGTGYPHGLSAETLSMEARILAVVDSYDAMTHDRPHRAAMSPAEAIAELRRCSPAGYDSKCVKVLAGMVLPVTTVKSSPPFEASKPLAISH
ncbi:MAG: HD domain-containing protein [Phycisphaerae bacterium]|nr:HD domain-containing protein [Phycisphaerae bacterium]